MQQSWKNTSKNLIESNDLNAGYNNICNKTIVSCLSWVALEKNHKQQDKEQKYQTTKNDCEHQLGAFLTSVESKIMVRGTCCTEGTLVASATRWVYSALTWVWIRALQRLWQQSFKSGEGFIIFSCGNLDVLDETSVRFHFFGAVPFPKVIWC